MRGPIFVWQQRYHLNAGYYFPSDEIHKLGRLPPILDFLAPRVAGLDFEKDRRIFQSCGVGFLKGA